MQHGKSLASAWLGAVTGVIELLTESTGAIVNGLSVEYNMAEQRTLVNSLRERRDGRDQSEPERVRQTPTYTNPVPDRDPGDDQGAVRDHEHPQP